MISRIVSYFRRRAWSTPDARRLRTYAAMMHNLEPAWWEWPTDFYERVSLYEDVIQAAHQLELRKMAEMN